ncbi:MAG: hypothetical protein HY063_04675 [Bacteroidetes bacterium]|nr:hypothetical protein [Bacteroidota bacterium]
MKNLDALSKKILVSAISLSMILLCASLFVLSLNAIPQAKASAPIVKSASPRLTDVDIWPFGVVNGKAYWIEYNASGWKFKNFSIADWKDTD